ncbi:hypothetical protein [Nocardia cyriacigeorgica]|uniref:hypothetical protein n=1 Tax=Nocardia cyriacigeorgica TaxID=135487 RepID=UPI002453923C|nr:hypothetical protein [Nocardia cyriacigeorgica]
MSEPPAHAPYRNQGATQHPGHANYPSPGQPGGGSPNGRPNNAPNPGQRPPSQPPHSGRPNQHAVPNQNPASNYTPAFDTPKRTAKEWLDRLNRMGGGDPNSSPWSTPNHTQPNNAPNATSPRSADPSTTHPTAPISTRPTDNTSTPPTKPTDPNQPSDPNRADSTEPDEPRDTRLPDNIDHTPHSTSIGDDPTTHRVRENLRNEGDFDVIMHADRNGDPGLTADQIAQAIRDNPNYTPGTPVRIAGCHLANNPTLAQDLANRLNAPVTVATDAVGVPNKPDSPAHIRNGGQWVTHHPTSPTGETPTPTRHEPTATPPSDPDQPVDYMAADPSPASDGEEARRIMREQVRRANEEPGYFDRYYRVDRRGIIYRHSIDQADESGQVPPQLVRDRDTGRLIAASDAPPPIPPRYHLLPDPHQEVQAGEERQLVESVPYGRDTATPEALKRLDEAAQTRREAIDEDQAAERKLKELRERLKTDDTPENQEAVRLAEADHSPKHTEMGHASEAYGESIAAHHVIPEHYPNATPQPLDGPKNGNDQFDQVWLTEDGRYVVVEAKSSVDTELGARNIADGRRASQGTREYFEDIIKQMEERGKTNPTERALAIELREALAAGRVDYILVKGNRNEGEYNGYSLSRFNIDNSEVQT